MEVYRRPYREPGESRRPILSWTRQVVIEGEPADVAQVMKDNGRWLPSTDLPKLYVNADPGSLRAESREFIRSWPNLTEVTVPGLHFIQEDSPNEIGQAIAEWYPRL